MQTYKNLYEDLCSFRNLELAFRKARKSKGTLPDVRAFSFNLEQNLFQLKHELENFTYEPQPPKHFMIRDPKTRLISASNFRDRVVHHALCNIIEPLFEKVFIHDSYANRKGKGTLAAMKRFDEFKKNISCNGVVINKKNNNMVLGFALKCDIKHYFQEVDHDTLMKILERKIKDRNVLWLIQKIIDNHNSQKGMPIGNLTSQFFANVYLNELDYFVKHELRAKFYIRYVDDFIILHESRETLEEFKTRVNEFLAVQLKLELHPDKSKIYPFHKGVRLLGFRCFYYFCIPKKSNMRQFELRLMKFKELFDKGEMGCYDVNESVEGWLAYVELGNTYKMRDRIVKEVNKTFIK